MLYAKNQMSPFLRVVRIAGRSPVCGCWSFVHACSTSALCAWFLLLIIQATFESTLLRVAIYITLNNVRSIVIDSKMAKDNSDALVSSASPSC